ncbi:glucokinase [Martiniozyma asiatica (nom. inval.)]|nr:glucokinase [Martiniozyma asiatica]
MNLALKAEVDRIIKEFELPDESLPGLVDLFIKSATEGLSCESSGKSCMPMIPTFVTNIPTGREKGILLAADLGGTNFRVCSVALNGDHTFKLLQSKNPIPVDLMSSTSAELFSYLAGKIGAFVKTHHSDKFNGDEAGDRLKLGFTFSFPVEQSAIDSGKLIRWSKGFNIPDTVGKDVVSLLQEQLDRLQVPVHVAALANDTVGTLLARAYTGADKEGSTSIGCIFGTGTNGAYCEKLENIKKLPKEIVDKLKSNGIFEMVINTEWGSFDNNLELLPVTKYDAQIDKLSTNPGYHLFEKRVSGMFLGEILRNVLIDLHSQGLILTSYATYDTLPHRIKTPWLLSSEGLSLFEIDDSTKLRATELELKNMLRLPTTYEERVAIQEITRAISKRAAHLAAVPITALLIKLDAFKGHHTEVDVGADGSVVEFYPGFRTMMRDAVASTQLGPKGERRLHINISKDGSSVGAALCALSTKL